MNKISTANLPPLTPRESIASGIEAVELSAKELDRVTGGASVVSLYATVTSLDTVTVTRDNNYDAGGESGDIGP